MTRLDREAGSWQNCLMTNRPTASTEVKMTTMPDCNICTKEGMKTEAKYDAKSLYGWWAYFCQDHWERYTPQKLGTGYGQRLVKVDE